MGHFFSGSYTDSRAAIFIFLFFICLYAFSWGGHFYTTDGLTFYWVLSNTLSGRGPVIPQKLEPFGTYGPDGRLYSKFGLGHSIVILPFFLLGKAAGFILSLGGGGDSDLSYYSSPLTNTFVSALLLSFYFLEQKKWWQSGLLLGLAVISKYT